MLARSIVEQLIVAGVRDVVMSPGSRNAPLSFALFAADAAGLLRLHVRIDERTAGFLALGLARGSGRVAAVATTSGTAVANLHPAVLEAHHDGVPLLVLSADRPAYLRGRGANQMIDQHTVFGAGVLRCQRVWGENPADAGDIPAAVTALIAAAYGEADGSGVQPGPAYMRRPGPVQFNIPFEMPLVPDTLTGRPEHVINSAADPATPAAAASSELHSARGSAQLVAAPEPDERCLFVVDMTNSTGADLSTITDLGYPVISEIGGLAGAGVLAGGIALLECTDFVADHLPDRVIMLGRPTLYREVNVLLARTDVVIDMVAGPAGAADVAGVARVIGDGLASMTSPCSKDWSQMWRAADVAARGALARTAIGGPAVHGFAAGRNARAEVNQVLSSPVVAALLGRLLPPRATLVVGSSQPPRDCGWFSTARDGVRVIANRGVAGIDGMLSTAIGVALTSSDPVTVLVGDLTFMHDMTALALGPHEPRPNLTIVVVNNDGGGIFTTLEQGATELSEPFERIFGTPTGVDIGQIAAGMGVEYQQATTIGELGAALAATTTGIRILEVPVDRDGLRQLLADCHTAVAAALGYAAATVAD